MLRAAIEGGELFSMIFFGPPGCGKTTLARLIAAETGARLVQLSAVNSGTADVRAAIQGAREARALSAARTILFIDEIHRFNKAQQDALLPAIEDAVVTLIGATTENPYFEVNSALISRCQLYRFEPLPPELVEQVVQTALDDAERGLGDKGVTLADGRPAVPRRDLARRRARGAQRSGDRVALARRGRPARRGRVRGGRPGAAATPVTLTVDDLRDAAQKSPVSYDREDSHYDTISAFIKSMRGSDPDAAIYYMASMLAGGEDPKFIARRMIVFASEDVGNADPQALQVAIAASRAVEFVGLPECRINLSQAAAYLALAPKSNAAYKAVDAALDDVKREGNQPPPAASARRQLPGGEGARPRRRLPVSARPRRLGGAAVPARQALRPPLLRADTRGGTRDGGPPRRRQAAGRGRGGRPGGPGEERWVGPTSSSWRSSSWRSSPWPWCGGTHGASSRTSTSPRASSPAPAASSS